ncbi:MAG: hydantoinase B/oxoprolinase family protein, partial [Actinobacteria bacterium]|nr:hydantoinase B/oxoprolinase family protein [Actinomycetota bacterium]
LPDIYVAQPVFVDAQLCGHVVTIAHHTDVGGKTAGGNGCDATELVQEGLCLPPVRLMAGGTPVASVWRIIERNVRVPEQVLGDLRAQVAAGHVGARGLRELVQRHGVAGFAALSAATLDYAEAQARHAIRAIPDGVYAFTDYLDDDGIDPGPLPIRVAITVCGDELKADFTGTAPQVRGGINCAEAFTESAVYACVRCLMPTEMPNNEGYFRPIHVVAPEGSLVNPRPGAAVAARGLTGFRIANAVFGALAQAVPGQVPAAEAGGDTGVSLAGFGPDGRAFVLLEFLFASWGGRPFADGVDGAASLVVNFSNNPVEMIEAELPIAIDKYEFVPDTGGDGQYRGGLALERHYRILADQATLQLRSDRRRRGPYGLGGGKPGGRSRNTLVRNGRRIRLPGKATVTIVRGDVFEHQTAGAGGWGRPDQRDPAARARDLREGKVTRGI